MASSDRKNGAVKIDKGKIIRLLREKIAEEMATMTRLAKEAAQAAAHEENKPENDKDMRSTEASYVARGQAARARELERAHAMLGSLALRDFGEGDTIEAGALVELQQGATKSVCFLVPTSGGQRVKVDGVEVQTVTPTSPLGEALVGLEEGDEAEVTTPQGLKIYEILRVW